MSVPESYTDHSVMSLSGDLGTTYVCVNCHTGGNQRPTGECIAKLVDQRVRRGLTDRQIAFELDMDDDEVARWRRRVV